MLTNNYLKITKATSAVCKIIVKKFLSVALLILEYGLNFPPTSCHKYELVFLSKMFSREIEIDFLVCCDTVSLILTPATPNFNCSQKKKKKNQNK